MSNNLTFNLTEVDGNQTISVFDPSDGYTKVVARTHPNFSRILLALLGEPTTSDEDVKGLIDPSIGIGRLMAAISPRVSYDERGIYLDRIAVHGLLAEHIKRNIQTGDHKWERLVRFLLNVSENPSHAAQEATYQWIERHGVAITEDGRFVGYKGLQDDGTSGFAGPNNFIDGVLFGEPDENYHVPHEVGTVISKRRGDVDDNRNLACSTGLHVGAYDYARKFGHSVNNGKNFCLVAVNPRDVVSVPNHSASEWKIRVCEYEIIEALATDEDVLQGKLEYNLVKDAEVVVEEPEPEVEIVEEPEAEVVAVADEEPAVDTSPLDLDPEATLTENASRNKVLAADLADTSQGHKAVARKWSHVTSESSVRRYRKNNGITISLATKVFG